jgi:hypothetical protein
MLPDRPPSAPPEALPLRVQEGLPERGHGAHEARGVGTTEAVALEGRGLRRVLAQHDLAHGAVVVHLHERARSPEHAAGGRHGEGGVARGAPGLRLPAPVPRPGEQAVERATLGADAGDGVQGPGGLGGSRRPRLFPGWQGLAACVGVEEPRVHPPAGEIDREGVRRHGDVRAHRLDAAVAEDDGGALQRAARCLDHGGPGEGEDAGRIRTVRDGCGREEQEGERREERRAWARECTASRAW